MGANPLDVINMVRKRNGFSPLPDPTQIDGPPIPEPPLPDDIREWLEGRGESTETERLVPEEPEVPYKQPAPERPKSPLLEFGKSLNVPVQAQPQPLPQVDFSAVLGQAVLVVVDRMAASHGHPVELTDDEAAQIQLIVLRSAAKRLHAQMEGITGRPPRVRATRIKATEPAEPVKRKRGRPRKIKTD
jgi:hypothetical protein